QQPVADGRADRLGQAGDQTGAEGVPLVVGGEVDRHRDGDAFGDVVDGDREGQREADRRVLQGGEEGRQPLREVVRGDRDGGHQAHPADVFAVLLAQGRVVAGQGVVRVRYQ